MTANKSYSLCKSHGGTADERVLLQNHMISKLSRRDLEDRYYSIWSSNIGLKKSLNAQNEKIKFLNTKLARLTSQQKKDSIISNKCCRDFEDIIEEQSYRIHQLQKLNYNLIEKIETLEAHISDHTVHNRIPEIILNDGDNIEEMLVICEDASKVDEQADKRSLEPIVENNIEHMEEKIAYLEKEIEILKCDNMQDISRRNPIDEAIDPRKDFGVQTEQNDTNKMTDMIQENESLKKKLTEERLKVSELEQKLESNTLKSDILEIVQTRLNLLHKKVVSENKQENNEKNVSKYLDSDEYQVLETQLTESRMNIESLRVVNKQLCSQILEMQSKLDILNLQNKTYNNQKERKNSQKLDENIEIESTIENPTEILKNEIIKESEVNKFDDSPTRKSGNNQVITVVQIERVKSIEDINVVPVQVEELEDVSEPESPIKNILEVNSEETEDDVKSLEDYQAPIVEVNEEELKSEVPILSNNQDNNGYENLEESHSDSERFVNNLTYDISTNNSLDCCNSSMNSLSEDYLSDGEVRKDSVINLHRHTSRNSSASNPKILNDPKAYSRTRDISSSIQNTIEEIAKEREKCKKLLNVKIKKVSSDISLGEIVDLNNLISKNIPSKNDLNSTFVLNITSVELTEEAMNLIQEDLYFLTWKFYKEVIAYTPLCRDRISNFNFSSTYNVVMDDDFIAYLSNNNIEIDIHKATDDTSKCFARCKINLFEMFSKINEKVNFVLKLEKYPDNCDDENEKTEMMFYGTLKCWCKLTYKSLVN